MTRGVLAAIVAALVTAAPASAQVDRHRGKVAIGSAAGDALVINGGLVVGNLTDPSGQTLDVRSTADDLSSGVRISRADANNSYFILNMNSGSAFATLQAGNGLGFLPIRINPNGGQVLIADGSVSSPALAFVSDATAGLYYSTNAVNVATASRQVAGFSGGTNVSALTIWGAALGVGAISGARVEIGRNSSGAGAPGTLILISRTGTASYVWADTTGVLRINSSAATESGGDVGGTVVGTQTSTRASKSIVGEVTNTWAAMAIIRSTPVYQFTYKSGAYNGETFFGIVTDDSPLFGMDGGKSFNPVTAFGATVLALRDLDARVAALEARR